MKKIKLGDICEVLNPSVSNFNGNLDYIATGDVDLDRIVNKTSVTYKTKPSRANTLAKVNDVLIAKMQNTLKVLIIDESLSKNIYSTGFAVLRIKDINILKPKLLYHIVKSDFFNKEKDKLCSGTTQKAINLTKLREIKIPLPSIEEQERIIQILDQVYENIGWDIDDKIADLKALKKTAIDKAIRGLLTTQNPCESAEELYKGIQEEKEKLLKEGKIKKSKKDEINPINEDEIPFEIPKNWKWCRLGEVSYKLTDGSHNPPKGQSIKTDYLMLSSKNINNSMITNLKECRYLNQSDYESENNRTLLQKEDLLLTTVGTIGRSCLYDGELNIVLQRSVSVINTGFYNKYLKYLLDSNYGQSYLMEHASGTAQKGIYLNQLKEMPVVIPPLEEQERIVNILSAIDSDIDSAIDSAIELQEDNKKLLDSLLNKFLN